MFYNDYDFSLYQDEEEYVNRAVREYMDKKPLDILDFDNRGSEGTETKKSVKAVDENTLVLSYVNDRYKEDASQILTYIYKRSR